MNDGSERVDWEKMQNIFIDLWYNLQLYNARRGSRANIMLSMPGAANPLAAGTTSSSGLLWDSPFTGIAPNSYISQKLSGTMAEDSRPELTAQDPYGVRGTWTRIVCFLDYNDLYAFNFEAPLIPLDVERPPVDTREAFRLIKLQLRVTSIEFDEDDDLKGDDDKSKGKPVVYFEGQSKSTYMAWDPNANSRIRGESWISAGTAALSAFVGRKSASAYFHYPFVAALPLALVDNAFILVKHFCLQMLTAYS